MRKLDSSRKSIHIDQQTHSKFTNYSKLTGVPIQTAVIKALNEWMETNGNVHMEVLASRAAGKLIGFPRVDDRQATQLAAAPPPTTSLN